MRELEKQLKALANRRRLAILKFLRDKGEASVREIAEEIKLSFKATSKHLSVLAARDVIDREQRGLQMFYSLADKQDSLTKQLLSLL